MHSLLIENEEKLKVCDGSIAAEKAGGAAVLALHLQQRCRGLRAASASAAVALAGEEAAGVSAQGKHPGWLGVCQVWPRRDGDGQVRQRPYQRIRG